MLSSIHPLGERSKGNRWGLTVGAHVLASAGGGALSGAGLGWAGPALGRAALPVALGAALVALTLDTAPAPLPRWRRQVDERWLVTYRGWVYGAGYGVQLGAGLATIVTTATVYLVFLLAFLSGSAATGAVIGGVFGLARGSTVLAAARVHTAAQLRDLHRRLAAAARPSAWLPRAADALVVLAAGAALAGVRP